MPRLLSALFVGASLLSLPLRAQAPAADRPAPIAQLLHMDERLARYNVPGLSVAIVDHGHILWARGFGLRAPGRPPVDARTLFQAGSLSKPVAAAVALAAASAAHVSPDRPINEILAGWQLADGAGPARDVTLRRLLSHTAGINVHGFHGYREGETLPSLDQVLAGAPPANSPRIAIETMPGAGLVYSGGGYVIVQKAIEDMTRRPFAAIAAQSILAAAHMRDSRFATTLPPSSLANAAAGHDAEGRPLPGGWHHFVELAPAGLWTTPSDLARFAIWLSRRGNPVGREMLTRQRDGAGAIVATPGGAAAGLGLLLAGDGSAFRFSVAGANPGQKAYIVHFPGTGQGAVIMANGDGAPRLIQELLVDLARLYRWPDPLLPAARPGAGSGR